MATLNCSIVPDLMIPGLAGINTQYVIPASPQLEELLQQGYPSPIIFQQLQLAQVYSTSSRLSL